VPFNIAESDVHLTSTQCNVRRSCGSSGEKEKGVLLGTTLLIKVVGGWDNQSPSLSPRNCGKHRPQQK
jgi:hypothetical protein